VSILPIGIVASVAALLIPAEARGTPVQLRMAAIAPDGTAWARELRALARDIEVQTAGEVKMKWYLGAIAGDELTALDRIRRGQLDGIAGASYCDRLAPSLHLMRLVGLLRSDADVRAALARLRPQIEKEMHERGFVTLGTASFGPWIIFSRTPIASMKDLRNVRLWGWTLEDVMIPQLEAMGVHLVHLPIEEAGHAWDEGKLDGFITLPTAALAYQFSARSRYFTEISPGPLPGCIVVSEHAFDQLSFAHQQTVRAAAAKFAARFVDVGREQDRTLLGGLFERQGVRRVPVSKEFADEFYAAAAKAREQVGMRSVGAEAYREFTDWVQALHDPSGATSSAPTERK
jgi:TRAP-type C4-dicarboxylate transport system substrate-binding protein